MGQTEQEIADIRARIKRAGLTLAKFSRLAGYDYLGQFMAFLNGQYKPAGPSYLAHKARIEAALKKAEG